MKDMITATAVMAAIILVQIVISFAFTYHAGELFSKTAFVALFYHYVFKADKIRKGKIR